MQQQQRNLLKTGTTTTMTFELRAFASSLALSSPVKLVAIRHNPRRAHVCEDYFRLRNNPDTVVVVVVDATTVLPWEKWMMPGRVRKIEDDVLIIPFFLSHFFC